MSFNMPYWFRTSMFLFCLLVASVSVYAQDINPGASPAWVIGNAKAPVSIEVFNDYQCPPCGTFNEQLKKIEAEYKDNVRIIFRNFPITNTHQNALLAAQTAEAAGLQGHFVEMINHLYGNAKYWAESENPRQLFMSYAQELRLDLDRFALDLDGELVRERIRLDVARAKSLGVNGTPTILLDGKMLAPAKTADIASLIEQALNRPKP
jgi:protein-disulfide isomerase